MEWLWILLRYLFPLDPVRQCIEALRDRTAAMLALVFNDEALTDLASDPLARIDIEAVLIDYESTLRLTIAGRAHQIAGLRFHSAPRTFPRPTHARSLVALIRRIQILARDCADIERLAQLQAARLKRQRDADPLSAYAGHGSPRGGAAIKSNHEAVGVSSASSFSLILSSTRSVRPSKDEAERPQARTRGPPIFDVIPNQTPRLAGSMCEVATRGPRHCLPSPPPLSRTVHQ